MFPFCLLQSFGWSEVFQWLFGGPVKNAVQKSSWLEINAWISFSSSFWFKDGCTFVMFLKWIFFFVTLLMWDLNLRSESKIMSRPVILDLIQGDHFFRLLNIFILRLTGRTILSSFNFKKLLLFHLFNSNKQLVTELSIIWY